MSGSTKAPTFNTRAASAIEDIIAKRVPQLAGKVFVRYNLRRRNHLYIAHHRGDCVFVHFHTPLSDPRVWEVIDRVAEGAASMVCQSSHATAIYGPDIREAL